LTFTMIVLFILRFFLDLFLRRLNFKYAVTPRGSHHTGIFFH
jgi:hypothetical protein